jgi:hypothetical protein
MVLWLSNLVYLSNTHRVYTDEAMMIPVVIVTSKLMGGP